MRRERSNISSSGTQPKQESVHASCSSPLLSDTSEPSLHRRLDELETAASTTERVRVALFDSLPSGQASMDSIAKKLAVSKRTLQRHLKHEETSFQHILNTTRNELALHYLKKTTITYAEISFLLGFQDPNSFFRAFHDWTGRTPETVRLQMT